MLRRLLTVLICIIALSLSGLAASRKPAKKAASSGPLPDKAYMQKVWDGWGTLDPSKTAQFYAQGPHTFYDLAPVKYDSWDEYDKGVRNILAGYKSAKFTVNDDAQIHAAGDYAWGTATLKSDMMQKSGKRDMATFRWTVVFEKQDGKWLIVHEHVSEPIQ
jgi:ketosteroid isomerase-like protein